MWLENGHRAEVAVCRFSSCFQVMYACSIDDRLALKERLHCKSFRWYLDNVYPQLKQLKMPASDVTTSMMRQGNMCLDTLGHLVDNTLGIFLCHNSGGNQVIILLLLWTCYSLKLQP